MTIQYLRLLQRIKDEGHFKGDRTGTGTQSLFKGHTSTYDLTQGFPLLTTKKMFTRGIVEELLWILRGDTNVRGGLTEKGVHIWDEWMDPETGSMGPGYGYEWRHWNGRHEPGKKLANPDDDGAYELVDSPGHDFNVGGRDQLAALIERIKDKPDDRRLIVTAWNPDDTDRQKLPPCHILFQCWTRELTLDERENLYDNKFRTFGGQKSHGVYDEEGIPRRGLSLTLYQRSCDVFLGVPFNIASYALLTHMIAQVVGMVALDFNHVLGDVHIYNNHREQVDLQLTREPRKLPRLWLNPEVKDIDGFTIDDIKILDYKSWPKIKAPVSV